MNSITITDGVSGREIIISYEEDDFTDISEYTEDELIERFVEYSDLIAIRERASVDELLAFANKIREVGGSNNMLHELIPSYPTDSESCLIANALNFNSTIEGGGQTFPSGRIGWVMNIHDEVVANNIKNSNLGLDVSIQYDYDYDEIYNDETGEYEEVEVQTFLNATVYLPEEIGLCAAAFDSYHDAELEQFNAYKVI